jgi:hypothetical protein
LCAFYSARSAANVSRRVGFRLAANDIARVRAWVRALIVAGESKAGGKDADKLGKPGKSTGG